MSIEKMTKQTIDNTILKTAQNVHNVIKIAVMYITVISVGTVATAHRRPFIFNAHLSLGHNLSFDNTFP